MKAVWSYWSHPVRYYNKSAWMSEKHHMLGWILSLETARQNFERTELYTDDEGASLLIDTMGLEFDYVSTSLNGLEYINPEFWALGKVYTYKMQQSPFVHIDSDVFIWNDFPSEMKSAPLIVQNPEHFRIGTGSWYHPEKFDEIKNSDGWLPKELEWYRNHSMDQRAECCGIFGGNNLEFIQYYAENSIRLVEDNSDVWKRLGGDNILVEQYLLTALIEYHRSHPSEFNDLLVWSIFGSSDDAFNAEWARKRGYSHLIGGAKKNKNLLDQLEERVKFYYPDQYEHCISKCNELVYA